MRNSIKILILLIISIVGGWLLFSSNKNKDEIGISTPFSKFYTDINKKEGITRISIEGGNKIRFFHSGIEFYTIYPYDFDMKDIVDSAIEKGIVVNSIQASQQSVLMQIFISWFPMLLLFGILIFFMRQMQGASGALSLGRSRARLIGVNEINVTFADVAGIEEAKEQVVEIVDFLQNPSKVRKLGGKMPKGVLLMGLPGTGKTLLAKAIAGEAKVPFFTISGSDFVEMFVGVGASRIRDMFKQARKSAPSIIFIDEIDAVARRRRSKGSDSGNDEREQTLNQLLVELDGFDGNEGVIVIAATNRPDVLDPALLRHGRFDRRISVPLPNTREREEILRIFSARVRVDVKVSPKNIADTSLGFSGADLHNVVNEAALLATRRNQDSILREDIEDALEKVRRDRRDRIAIETSEDKWRIAIHEIGHLSASFCFPCLGKLDSLSLFNPHKPNWFELGKYSFPSIVRSEEAEGTLVVLLAGRAAEKFFLGDTSNISASDLAIATALAHEMVMRWGMSDGFGLINDQIVQLNIVETYGMSGTFQDSNESKSRAIKKLLQKANSLALHHVDKHSSQIAEWAASFFESEKFTSTRIDKLKTSPDFRSKVGTGSLHSGRIVESDIQIENDLESENSEDSEPNYAENSVRNKILYHHLKKEQEVLEIQIAALGELQAPPTMLIRLDEVKNKISQLEDNVPDDHDGRNSNLK